MYTNKICSVQSYRCAKVCTVAFEPLKKVPTFGVGPYSTTCIFTQGVHESDLPARVRDRACPTWENENELAIDLENPGLPFRLLSRLGGKRAEFRN